MEKVINPGTVPNYNGRRMSVYCKIRFVDGKLSISGVEGPLSSGNALGSCGQIDMHYAHRNEADNDKRGALIEPGEFNFAEGWNADLWLDLLDVWKRWHLNDMRAGCEHVDPRAAQEERTIYHWRLTREVRDAVKDAMAQAEQQLRAGEAVSLDADALALVQLPHEVTTASDTAPSEHYEPNGPRYDGDTYNRPSEVKTRGWLRPSEHPDGLLGKPCEACGYAYGTAWKMEDVPADVIAFLEGLPESAKAPAWV